MPAWTSGKKNNKKEARKCSKVCFHGVSKSARDWRLLLMAHVEGKGRLSYLRQLIPFAALAVEPFVGFGVVHKLPALGVPAQLLVVPVGQIAQVADGYRAGADFDVADRFFPACDAVEPVLLVARRLIELDVLVAERLPEDVLRIALDEAAIDIDGAVGADEKDAASLAGVNDLDAIGIDVPDAFVGLGVLGRDDLNRAGFIHAEPPLGNVEM